MFSKVMKMSDTLFQKYKAELDGLFFDYLMDYEQFRDKGEKLLDDAINHPEIGSAEFLALVLIYEDRRTYLEGAFLED